MLQQLVNWLFAHPEIVGSVYRIVQSALASKDAAEALRRVEAAAAIETLRGL